MSLESVGRITDHIKMSNGRERRGMNSNGREEREHWQGCVGLMGGMLEGLLVLTVRVVLEVLEKKMLEHC